VAKPAIFLDRDGVLNQEVGYIYQLEDLNLIPGVAQAVRRLNDLNLFCCLVTNQAGAARGYYPLDHITALNNRLCRLLHEEAGAKLNAVYSCHTLSPPAGGKNPEFARWSTWRKPNTGMLVAAAWEYDLDLSQSYMVGDKSTDVDMANNVGAKGILVKTGYGKRVLTGDYQHHADPVYIAADLVDAVEWIVSHQSSVISYQFFRQ
jgi:D-glycero-D-manno-heptose 1,7-bisphosphate phosphatase